MISMAEVKVVKIEDVQSTLPAGHTNTDSWKLVSPDIGANNVTFFVTEMRPGAVASKHVHPKSDHVYFILSGRASMTVGGKSFTVGPHTAVYVPPNTEHETKTVGTETLRFVVLMAPPP